MDLSEAFECLLHDLFIAKLEEYGKTIPSFTLIKSSTVKTIYKGQRAVCVSVVSLLICFPSPVVCQKAQSLALYYFSSM